MPNRSHQNQTDRPLSKAEIARYLRSLAELHSDPYTGNIRLSNALRNLANSLHGVKLKGSAPDERQPAFNATDFSRDQVFSFIHDEKTAKSDLILLAKQRFSIPSSRLNKMPRRQIVETIVEAMQHEQSLIIIAEEATRDARLRSS
ncbi:hypothetical protein [Brevundimonas vesicularis]|uniref:hypothetical protein n=1 Tax=Brevundimonas vesicularis TaxID=41276 RepID=UPI0011BD967C|nr:hypothetical protein [Brevundimonas vesicularis]